MNLKLIFIGVDDNDVIATSGALTGPCAYTGTNNKLKYLGSVRFNNNNFDGYVFEDLNGTTNAPSVEGETPDPFIAGYRVDGASGFEIIDTDGNQMTAGTRPSVGSFYHLGDTGYYLYLCNNPSHQWGTFE